MSPRSATGRLARLMTTDRDELRFRLTSEVRKGASRLRYAISPPRSRRSRLAAILVDGDALDAARRHDYLSAHRALAEHFRTRASTWPIS